MRRSTNLWFSILIPQLSPLPRTLQSLLSPITPTRPPQHPIGLCLQNKQPPSPLPLTPCSHIPLSRAAAVHKYINLVLACTCVRTWRRRCRGVNAQTAGRQPRGRALFCVPSQTLSVYTSDPSSQTRQRRPEIPPPSLSKQADKSPGG